MYSLTALQAAAPPKMFSVTQCSPCSVGDLSLAAV